MYVTAPMDELWSLVTDKQACWLAFVVSIRNLYSPHQPLLLLSACSSYPLDVTYCMKKLAMLKFHGVVPYMVFDGAPLPSKAGTEDERRRLGLSAGALGCAFRLNSPSLHRPFLLRCVLEKASV